MADILNQGNSGGARQKKGSLHQQKFQKGSEVPMDIERRRRVERLMAGTAADAAAVADINAPHPAVYRPPFWQSKVYGEPHGDFSKPGAAPPMQPPGGVARNRRGQGAPGFGESPRRNPHKGWPHQPADPDNKVPPKPPPTKQPINKKPPLHAQGKKDQVQAFAADNALGNTHKQPARPTSAAAKLPPGHLEGVEDRMRERLNKDLRKQHETAKHVLVTALRREIAIAKKPQAVAQHQPYPERRRQGWPASAPHTEGAEKDAFDAGTLIKTWQKLGVEINLDEANALMDKYGRTEGRRTPVEVFASALLVGKSRLLGMAGAVRYGAFDATVPSDWNFRGKVIYPPCRKPVYTPTGWDGSACSKSAAEPSRSLQLEWVHGYAGMRNLANNIFYNCEGRFVYYTAALGIVFDEKSHTQTYFTGHDDDVTCLAMSPSRDLALSGQMGADPKALLWDTRGSCRQVRKINHGKGYRSVIAACFSSSGTKAVTVCTDNSHTMFVWDLQIGKVGDLDRPAIPQLLFKHPAVNGKPPHVYGVVWSGLQSDRIVTYGVNHLAFWHVRRTPAGIAATKEEASFAKVGKQSVLSACVTGSAVTVTGAPDGQLLVWKDGVLSKSVRAHGTGPVITRPDGSESFGGVRVLKLRANQKFLLSGGSDGRILEFAVDQDRGGALGAQTRVWDIGTPGGSGVPPMVRGLDCKPGDSRFIVGTARCDIWEVDDSPSVLVYGHSADVYGLAWHPDPSKMVYATASEAGRVYVWDAKRRKILYSVAMGAKCRSVAFSPDGKHIAVGMRDGGLKIVETAVAAAVKGAGPSPQAVFWNKICTSAIDDLKYSHDGKYLAVASHDQCVDVYSRSRINDTYKHLGRCTGHSSTVRHVDWSADGKLLQTVASSYEVLYFEVPSCRQVKTNQKDTPWHTYTCILGFPVMGIWKPDSDGTDVNSVDRSPDGSLLVSADDFGKVNLYNYPVVIDDAPCHVYPGHSSHVMNVRFAPGGDRVASVGGHDRAIFQWRVVDAPPAFKEVKAAPWAPDVDPAAPNIERRPDAAYVAAPPYGVGVGVVPGLGPPPGGAADLMDVGVLPAGPAHGGNHGRKRSDLRAHMPR